MRDGRQGKFSLDENGFTFVEHRTAVRDFLSENLPQVYSPEVAALIQKISGAGRVHVFDHTLRSGDEGEREAKLLREPVLSAPNDYTDWSGPNRVRELLPQESETLLRVGSPSSRLIAERRYPHRVGPTYRLRVQPAAPLVLRRARAL